MITKNNGNVDVSPVHKRYYRLRIYQENEAPFDAILEAVNLGYLQMVKGKKHTLKQIVELGIPGLWGTLSYYTRRCMGASFATQYYKDAIRTVKMVNPDQSPIKYLRV